MTPTTSTTRPNHARSSLLLAGGLVLLLAALPTGVGAILVALTGLL